ncbi:MULTISPECIES: nitroreductase family protein [Lysinibacillus]|uniref:nitroreductase family protein n=1 Tax=Lysinibacillus TaxID=400634 RepID=UPI000E202658|nr:MULTISPECIES: nitroreductase family protein [Lysinibacillus]MCR6524946.1 nitroreductase family protein [Lysinibacillus capsici]MCT1541988.1 nitroreductase family protein [Lysinibacillus capsici]MCT1573224.1 nitroreductase family protein [Lysinibacillus capsici]MCT1650236.1 nitroreductase family protein [Lysinibacillus capsici]MCT1728620.1 nitroreductase family protein [Lysinibacillus capsici]
MSVKDILEKRRSVRHYDSNYKISSETLTALVESASKSPNGNNIQATRYLIIEDANLRNLLLPIAFNQQQIVEASTLIVMLGDYQAFNKGNIIKIHEEGYQAGYFDESLRDYLANAAINYYESKTKEDLKLELTRDVSLASMSLVLLANEAGFDTITMSGYDSKKLKEILNISDRYLDVMLIAIGKGIKAGHKTVRHNVNKVIYKNEII